MSDFNHKEASEQIAKIYGVDVRTFNAGTNGSAGTTLITQDIGEMMRLANRNGICYSISLHDVTAYRETNQAGEPVNEVVECITNDPIEATCVAIAKALIKKGGE